jgi:hypothetical protein
MFYSSILERETGHAGAEGAAKNKVVARLRCAKRAVPWAAAGESAHGTALVTHETRH